MTTWTVVAAIVLGLGAGMLSGMFGVGGGILFVPTLVLLGLGQVEAAATSLLAIVPTAAVGAWRQRAYGNLRIRAALLLVRLVLAKLLYDPPNFLVLDEPTNHLDVSTKEMLVRALAGYEGTMLLVSHDRRFLSALTNRVLELTPEGPIPYGGGYSEYVARTGREGPGLRHLVGGR